MPVFIQCDACGRRLRVRTDLVGKSVRCPGCKAKFLAQAIAEQTAPVEEETAATAAGTEEMPPLPVSANRAEDTTEAVSPPTRRRRVETTDQTAPERAPDDEATVEMGPASSQEPAPERAEEPYESPPRPVFVVLGLVLLLTAVLGLIGAWCISATVKDTVAKRAQQAIPTQASGAA
ncbi:MAG TPA: hypothetical protein VEL76_42370 [Gemmataceae bacterium]|nr:hypothetical protein [Gemmataceae bacterium]